MRFARFYAAEFHGVIDLRGKVALITDINLMKTESRKKRHIFSAGKVWTHCGATILQSR